MMPGIADVHMPCRFVPPVMDQKKEGGRGAEAMGRRVSLDWIGLD